MKIHFIKTIIIALLILPLVSCSLAESDFYYDELNEKVENKDKSVKDSRDPNVIRIWGYPLEDSFKRQFEKDHPGMKIQYVPGNQEMIGRLLDQMAEGTAPDIINIQYKMNMGKFNYIDGLEDLLKPPYNAKEMLKKTSQNQLSWAMSTDGKKLLALPMVPRVNVTYYREDIMRANGFPSEPYELGEFIQSPDNWLEIARKLKKDDKWIVQWINEPIQIYFKNTGFYDNKMSFVRNTEKVRDILYVTRAVRKEEMASFLGIWDTRGQRAIREDRIAMVYMSDIGEKTLQQWAPETAGKWRATRLPFGAYNTDESNAFAISKCSKNKELAWEIIKKIVEKDKKHQNDLLNQSSSFLGGQQAEKLYEELREKVPNYYFTPMDRQMMDLWDAETNNYLVYSYLEKDDSQAVEDIEKRFNHVYRKELSILSRYLEVRNKY